MIVVIDADGCPVVKNTIAICKSKCIEVIAVCDTSHRIENEYAKTITVDKGADSADFKIANMVKNGDIVITQDYGLAAMCLSKKAIAINQDGMQYTNDNIDALLLARHTAKKIRNAGGRTKNFSKRTQGQTEAFENCLIKLLKNNAM